MRALPLLLLALLVLPAAAAVIDAPEDPVKGRCVAVRSSGVSVTLANCMADVEWMVCLRTSHRCMDETRA